MPCWDALAPSPERTFAARRLTAAHQAFAWACRVPAAMEGARRARMRNEGSLVLGGDWGVAPSPRPPSSAGRSAPAPYLPVHGGGGLGPQGESPRGPGAPVGGYQVRPLRSRPCVHADALGRSHAGSPAPSTQPLPHSPFHTAPSTAAVRALRRAAFSRDRLLAWSLVYSHVSVRPPSAQHYSEVEQRPGSAASMAASEESAAARIRIKARNQGSFAFG